MLFRSPVTRIKTANTIASDTDTGRKAEVNLEIITSKTPINAPIRGKKITDFPKLFSSIGVIPHLPLLLKGGKGGIIVRNWRDIRKLFRIIIARKSPSEWEF